MVAVLVGVAALVGGTIAPASAAGEGVRVVRVAPGDVTAQAWECPSGNFCAWTGLDGTGSRCSWSDYDPDWRSGSITCSWSGGLKVQSYRNNGVSPTLTGVNVYQAADYGSWFDCAPQQSYWNVTAGGVFLRSHRWTAGTCVA
ncbi:peptidase inhibitor family I36 protein [Actinosynnema sp. NPDC091369]